MLSGCIFIEKDSLTLGSRNNTESIILSHVMGQLIEDKTDIEVIYKENLGGSNVVWNAMLNGLIDVIPDYTGTIVVNYYHEDPGTAEETLEATKRLVNEDGIIAFNTFGFNNTYTLALDESRAEELGVKTFSDFAKVSEDFNSVPSLNLSTVRMAYLASKKNTILNSKTSKGWTTASCTVPLAQRSRRHQLLHDRRTAARLRLTCARG